MHDPDRNVGIRPEGLIRLCWVDIDRKPDRVSPYWHPYGQSSQLQALEREAAAAGCSVTLLRSSASGGLHALIALPEPVKAWRGHWLALELVSRAGMREAPGACELFPSRLDYSHSSNPADWAQSNGIRLPGQDGSALLVGTTTASDTGLIYSELLEAMEAAEAGAGWEELKDAAEARRTATRAAQKAIRATERGHRPLQATKKPCSVVWTGRGQSNDNLKKLTNWLRLAHPEADTVEALAPLIKAAAWEAPGFQQWASEETRRELHRGWDRRLAVWSLKKWRPPTAQAPKGDPEHNRRLRERTLKALQRALEVFGAAAAAVSKSMVACTARLNIKTVRKLWSDWLRMTGQTPIESGIEAAATHVDEWSEPERENPAVESDLPAIHTPLLTGGLVATDGAAADPALQQAPVLPSQSFDPAVLIPPTRPAEVFSPAAPVETTARPPDPPPRSLLTRSPEAPDRPLMPFRPEAVPANPWRARERAELAAWLGLAA